MTQPDPPATPPNPTPPAVTPTPPAPAPQSPPPDPHAATPPPPLPDPDQGLDARYDLGRALIYPFTQGVTFFRVVPLPVITFFDFTTLLSSLALRGWRTQLTRRLGRGEAEPLPPFLSWGRVLVDGIVVTIMRYVYWVPLIVLMLFFSYGLIMVGWELAQWGYESYAADETQSAIAGFLNDVLTDLNLDDDSAAWVSQTFGFLLDPRLDVDADNAPPPTTLQDIWLQHRGILVAQSIAPTLYLVLVWPLYRVAMVRYALTGNVLAFFLIPQNLILGCRLLAPLLIVFFIWLFMRLLLLPIYIVLAFTVVLYPFANAIALPIHCWTTGYLYGQLAREMAPMLSGRVPAPRHPNAEITPVP
ncbi:MAG: DUF4013 domain-containing protein [Planctomycetota bacterium]